MTLFRILPLVVFLASASPLFAADLAGRVVDRDDQPLSGVQIVATPGNRVATSDSDGRFRFDGLEPGAYSLVARAEGFELDRREVEVGGDQQAVTLFRVTAVPVALDEIVVTPSRFSILRNEPAVSVGLDREEILALPHLGDDLFKAVTILPGTSGNDISARFSIRGGRTDEVLVRYDGIELYEPYHLQDFQGAFSIIDPDLVAGVDLMTGGFPAEYGDRMGGVLEMTTLIPTSTQGSVGVSFLTTWLTGGGNFGDDWTWLASARRGYLDIVLGIVGDSDDDEVSPTYWDATAKLERAIGDSQTVSVHTLFADDQLSFHEIDSVDDRFDASTSYGNLSAWLRHQAVLGSSTVVDSTLSLSRVDRDRNGSETEFDFGFAVLDDRTLDVTTFAQNWSYSAGPRHLLRFGLEARRYDAEFDYFGFRRLSPGAADVRGEPRERTIDFEDTLDGEQFGVYVADRVRLLKPLTLELGVRYDDQELTGDDQISPRVNFVFSPHPSHSFRLAWGRFFQSQRPHELQVQDGETELAPAEESEQMSIGYERTFRERYSFRVDAYQRKIENPRIRYENIFDPFNPFGETEQDRFAIVADRSTLKGVEFFLRKRSEGKIGWWLSYALSSAEDRIGDRDQARSIDQTQAITFDLNYRPRQHWSFNFAWRYHSGWPTTSVVAELAEQPDGSVGIDAFLGPFYDENLSDYHRLDVRASRVWGIRRGELSLFLDIQNIYNRENQRGFDVRNFDIRTAPGGALVVTSSEEDWMGWIPSFGIGWQF